MRRGRVEGGGSVMESRNFPHWPQKETVTWILLTPAPFVTVVTATVVHQVRPSPQPRPLTPVHHQHTCQSKAVEAESPPQPRLSQDAVIGWLLVAFPRLRVCSDTCRGSATARREFLRRSSVFSTINRNSAFICSQGSVGFVLFDLVAVGTCSNNFALIRRRVPVFILRWKQREEAGENREEKMRE